ncbi:MAG: response regulator transcription factor [Segetibacter sp.]
MLNLKARWANLLSRMQTSERVHLKLAVVDDHMLMAKVICQLLESFGYSIIFDGSNGKDVIEKINSNNLPDVVLMDVNMPGMDGFETTFWLKQNHPTVKVLGFGLEDDEKTIIKLLKNGVDGYIFKDADPEELNLAIQAIYQKGSYYSREVIDFVVRYNVGKSI